MFYRRQIALLEDEIKVLREALNWYSVNENWKRRGIHPKGTPVRWEMSPAQKDHGARARAATQAARFIRMHAPIGRVQRWLLRWKVRRVMDRMRSASSDATHAVWEKHVAVARKCSVTVPAAKSIAPDIRPNGEHA